MHSRSHLDGGFSRCNNGGKCVFGYPQPLHPTAQINANGRVLYRRDTEEDRWVASYMPCLTELLDCHVNVDVCFTVNVFMYLFKYLFKGPDRAKFTVRSGDQVDQQQDEVQDYVKAN
jgi:hypothetical protein